MVQLCRNVAKIEQATVSIIETLSRFEKTAFSAYRIASTREKLLFKGKERDSKAYLDILGVKDHSKIVLIKDPINQEKWYLEIRKNAKVERSSKSISEVRLEVDKLAA
ncbi:hypothetical protein AAC387_Pa08g2177 [Persea americana]